MKCHYCTCIANARVTAIEKHRICVLDLTHITKGRNATLRRSYWSSQRGILVILLWIIRILSFLWDSFRHVLIRQNLVWFWWSLKMFKIQSLNHIFMIQRISSLCKLFCLFFLFEFFKSCFYLSNLFSIHMSKISLSNPLENVWLFEIVSLKFLFSSDNLP